MALHPLTKRLATLAGTVLVVSLIYHQQVLRIIVASGERTGMTTTRTFLNSLDRTLKEFLVQTRRLAPDAIPDDPGFAALDRAVRRVMGGTRIQKIKIYDPSGRTVYSTEPAQIGEDQSHNEGVRGALAGRITSSLVYRNTFNSMDGVVEDRDLIQTYAFVPTDPGRHHSLGVFEVYTDVTALVHRLERSRYQVLTATLVAMILLYGLHLGATRQAHRLIASQGETIEAKEQALEDSESLTSSLLDAIRERILVVDRSGRIVRSNRFVREHGHICRDGQAVSELLDAPDAGSSPDEALQAIERTFAQTQPQRGTLTRDRIDPQQTLSLDTYPVPDSRGRPRLAILYLRDVTEERRLQMQMCRQEKLMGFGALSAGYAHDLVNPLASLSSELELLEADASPEEIQESLAVLKEQVKRLSHTVCGMRDSFRSPQPMRERTPVAAAVEDAISRVRHEAVANGVSIATRLPDPLPKAPIGRNHLVMVLTNLIHNAIQAMPDGGKVLVTAETRPAGELSIGVTDSGPGMTPEEASRALDPLYTTKAEGLGLGLCISQEVIRSAGGRLELGSAPGEGTQVTVTFASRQ